MSIEKWINTRSRYLNNIPAKPGPVLYWMSRDQRVQHNWALLTAQNIALELQSPLIVAFNLTPSFPLANLRHYDFMLTGLKEVEKDLLSLNIPFIMLYGDPQQTLPAYIHQNHISTVVMDFSPLKIAKQWKQTLVAQTQATLIETDAHNIIPIWQASDKQEYAARTIRPKIHKQLPQYLAPIPAIQPMPPHNLPQSHQPTDWDYAYAQLNSNTEIKPITWLTPGPQAAQQTLDHFLTHKAPTYATNRNDPSKDALSNLSPYLHFGHISAQHIALQTTHLESFFEELVVRRELADNFCHHNPHYDSLACAPNWAQQTLADHQQDPREYLYTQQELEQALTHDPAWNAAQTQMLTTGKMHGYMRMYWAKKILEWTPSPAEAYQIAIYLNDTYSIDGRDPNGFTGIAWAIAGVHDRPWKERPIFGKIRYMNYNGLKRKFDIQSYIEKHLPSQKSLFN